MTIHTIKTSSAIVTGLFYLFMAGCTGYNETSVQSDLIVSGNSTATTGNDLASDWLFFGGVGSDLIAFLSTFAFYLLFYVVIKSVRKAFYLVKSILKKLRYPIHARAKHYNETNSTKP